MRLPRAVLASFLATLLSGSVAGAAQKPARKAGSLSVPPKANSIAELAARYDSSSCLECHKDAHDEWALSAHSRSIFGDGRTASTFKTTVVNGLMKWPASGVKSQKDVKVEHLMGCAKCHLPQLADATDKVAQEILTTIDAWRSALEEEDEAAVEKAKGALTSLNINCLICHNRNAIVHKWTDGYPVANTVYGSKAGEHPDPRFPLMAKGSIVSESIFCGQCHGLGPNLEFHNPTQCATAYGSYLFAYIPEGGNKTCQECHMRASNLGHNMQSYRSPIMAKQAVEMRVDTHGVVWRDNTTIRPKATVRIELTNRAGHALPDG
jgi:hypothetical protein